MSRDTCRATQMSFREIVYLQPVYLECIIPIIDVHLVFKTIYTTEPGIMLCMRPANERRRYNVTSFLIGWSHTQNDPCKMRMNFVIRENEIPRKVVKYSQNIEKAGNHRRRILSMV